MSELRAWGFEPGRKCSKVSELSQRCQCRGLMTWHSKRWSRPFALHGGSGLYGRFCHASSCRHHIFNWERQLLLHWTFPHSSNVVCNHLGNFYHLAKLSTSWGNIRKILQVAFQGRQHHGSDVLVLSQFSWFLFALRMPELQCSSSCSGYHSEISNRQ